MSGAKEGLRKVWGAWFVSLSERMWWWMGVWLMRNADVLGEVEATELNRTDQSQSWTWPAGKSAT